MRASHEGIRQALAEHGPMTSAEIHDLFPGSTHRDLAGMIGRMRRAKAKLIYTKTYRNYGDGPRPTPRAVYALGDKPCAKRPPPLPNKVVTARYRARKRVVPVSVPNSIFQLGAKLTSACPHCNHTGGSKVIETRHSSNGVRRRVRCGGCAKTYALYQNGAVLAVALSSTQRALAGLPR